ncbi:MAG: N-acetyltransferase family protein [Thalassospira sp.]|uniref:GNAT family N-acetyltransferase n=1 Tax=Thalassospira sp. TaxID=1912094 RepID=UPI003A8986CD
MRRGLSYDERVEFLAGDVVVRPVRPRDLDALIDLIADHAAFERSEVDRNHLRGALPQNIFGEVPRAVILVADLDHDIVGYLAASIEFSTWQAAEYLHMDCLYLTPECRGQGAGRMLMDAAVLYADERGLGWMEWQTPDWNAYAIGFYERLGAVAKSKVRFSLAVEGTSGAVPEPACGDAGV